MKELNDFEIFCNAHWNYKSKNLKLNLLRLSWNFLERISKIIDFIEDKIMWKVKRKISDKLERVYMKLDNVSSKNYLR